MILVVDNYDSFTYNLVQLLFTLGAEVRVVRNNAIDVAGALALGASHVVISPGPCTPLEAGISVDLVRASTAPLLGVCLGHQAIATAFGGRVVRAPEPVHGKGTEIEHDGTGLFEGLSPGFSAARYHSLVIERDSLPSDLQVTAEADRGIIMAVRHRTRPIVGVQFHPESVLTPEGPRLVRNFVEGNY